MTNTTDISGDIMAGLNSDTAILLARIEERLDNLKNHIDSKFSDYAETQKRCTHLFDDLYRNVDKNRNNVTKNKVYIGIMFIVFTSAITAIVNHIFGG